MLICTTSLLYINIYTSYILDSHAYYILMLVTYYPLVHFTMLYARNGHYILILHHVGIHDIVTLYLCTYHMHDMIALYFTKLVCTTSFLYTYASYIYFTLMHFTCLYVYLTCIHMIIYFIYYAFNYDEIWLGERPSYSSLTVAVIVWLLGTSWCLFLGNRWLASEHRSELGGIHELNSLVATLLCFITIVF